MSRRTGARGGGEVRCPMSAWHDAHAIAASVTCRLWENMTSSGSRVTGRQNRAPWAWRRSQSEGATDAGVAAWHLAHTAPDGSPARWLVSTPL